MKQRILFVIRGKLGDTLVAYSVLRDYLLRNPAHEVAMIVRANYVPLLLPTGSMHYELIPYRGRVQCWWEVFKRRWLNGRWDVFAVLWGTGQNLARLAKTSGASRRLYLDGRYRERLPEFPEPTPHTRQVDPAWRVARLLDAELPKPAKLVLDGLAQRWRESKQKNAIGICPISDEKRRNFSRDTLAELLNTLARRFPGHALYLLLNPGDEWVIPSDVPSFVQAKYFRDLNELVDIYLELVAWCGTDTGLYHLAAGMQIPCIEFFGPTVPSQNVMPEQSTQSVRLAVLSETHCDVKDCVTGDCLNLAVQNFCGEHTIASLAAPAACPLRAFSREQLAMNEAHEGPDTQAR